MLGESSLKTCPPRPAPRSCSPSPTSVQVDTPRNTGLVGRQELDGRKLASCLRMDGKAELLIIGASLPLSGSALLYMRFIVRMENEEVFSITAAYVLLTS